MSGLTPGRYPCGAAGEKGTLAPGKRDDLVVLSANPLAVAPEDIAAIRVLRTVGGGRVVHDEIQGDTR